MRLIKILAVFLLPVVLLVPSGCGDSDNPIKVGLPGNNPDPWAGLPAITPEMVANADFDNSEPGLMALWYGDELLASGALFARFRDRLKEVRETYGGSIPEANITFQFPYKVGKLLIQLSEEAAAEFRAGTYTEWDSLNTLFGVTSIDTSVLFTDCNCVSLHFKGQLHPKYLAEYYRPLAGVILCEPNGYGGDWSNMYPWLVEGKVTFLARDAWGDCPSGCLNSHFFYFRENDQGGMDYIGSWLTGFEVESEPEPEWWAEARAAYDFYR
nr:hypothetical protein [candidate division Zixibacteria bacterium]